MNQLYPTPWERITLYVKGYYVLNGLYHQKLFFVAVILCGHLSQIFAQTSITSNLPIVVVNADTEIPDDPKIGASFKITAANASGLHSFNISSSTNVFQYEGSIGIEIRGASSVLWPKKSYGFETVDPVTNDNIDVSLLGMPVESDWVLHACYGDKSFMRDVLTHHLYQQTGRYSPRTQYVELFLRQGGTMTYQGVYILMEKVKRSKGRIDITKLANGDSDPDKITGGYLVQMGENDDLKWSSPIAPNDAPATPTPIFHVEYPKLHKYTNLTNQALQFNYIRNYVTDFENALNGANYKDPLLGYRNFLDVDAMIDYFLIQEFTKNSDNWRFSTFFYKDNDSKGGRLVMGAPWDFDRALGNFEWWCYAPSVQPSDWAWRYNIHCPTTPAYTAFWPKRLLSDCYFAGKVMQRYRALRQTIWSNNAINAFLDLRKSSLTANGAINRNFTKWNILQTDVIHNPGYPVLGNTFDKEVDYLKKWIQDRLAWMDEHIAEIGTSTEPCDESSLPVVYKNFYLERSGQEVVINWSTSSETNSSHFEVEKSADAKKFTTIARIEAQGESIKEVGYRFVDNDIKDAMNYYRIRQVDHNGESRLTSIRAIAFADIESMPELYPNPAVEFVRAKQIKQGCFVTISNLKGEVLESFIADGKILEIPVRKYQPGTYILNARSNQSSNSFKFIVSE